MIHRYKSNGYNIVLDVNSGSVHVVDDIVYDMISFIEPLYNEGIKDADTLKAAVLNCNVVNYNESEVCEAIDEVVDLGKQGLLFTEGREHGEDVRMAQCKNCFAKFYCKGDVQDASEEWCELQRKRVESAIMEQAALAEEEEGI